MGVEISNQDEWFPLIKEIVVKKKGKRGLPKLKTDIDSGN